MKKITSLLVILFVTIALNAQTINQTATWPDANWTISGSYTAANLLLNPTTSDTHFKFDDAQQSHSGDVINLESPVIDLRTAFTAGEKVLKISLTMAFALTAATSETLGLQYWNADSSAWESMPDGSPSAGDSAGDYTNCTTGPQDIYLDFKDFTTNQQQNFKYRLFYNDGGLATGKGICMAAPSITSVNLSCNNAPTALHTTNVFANSANIGWTANSSEVLWVFEYGAAGFSKGSGTSDHANQNPTGIGGLTENTSYDFYVRADCTPANAGGAVYSPWSSKLNFTTTNACITPSGGTSNNIKPTSFDFNWAPQGSETSWEVEYGLVGYTQGGSSSLGNFESTNNIVNSITGLTASTSYDFYVRAKCSASSLSDWAGPYTITTGAYSLGWYNLQWPGSGNISAGDTFDVYAQVWSEQKTDVSGQTAAATDIKAWIGYSTTDTNPNTWLGANWIEATFNTASLNTNNDEYTVNLGATLTTAGTYYYASRFQLNTEPFKYGGFQGGPWNGTSNVSGVLTVTGTLAVGNQIIEGFSFYPNPTKDNMLLNAKESIDQVELYNLLGQQVMMAQPGVSKYKISTNNLKIGVYFMKVKVADKTGTYKVVKQ